MLGVESGLYAVHFPLEQWTVDFPRGLIFLGVGGLWKRVGGGGVCQSKEFPSSGVKSNSKSLLQVPSPYFAVHYKVPSYLGIYKQLQLADGTVTLIIF